MSKWSSEKKFTNWLGLAPNNKITGGKVISSKSGKGNKRANTAFRMAALSLSRSDSYLGAFHRRQRYRLGVEKAIVATGRKIAVIYYSMLKNGTWYYDYGSEYYENQYQDKQRKWLISKAQKLGLDVAVKECSKEQNK